MRKMCKGQVTRGACVQVEAASVGVGRQNCCHVVRKARGRDGDSSARLNEEVLWGPLRAEGRGAAQLVLS